jgi:hypothetical protein
MTDDEYQKTNDVFIPKDDRYAYSVEVFQIPGKVLAYNILPSYVPWMDPKSDPTSICRFSSFDIGVGYG